MNILITGQCAIGVNLKRCSVTAYCLYIEYEEEDGTIKHLLWLWPRLEFYERLKELADLEIAQLRNFSRKWQEGQREVDGNTMGNRRPREPNLMNAYEIYYRYAIVPITKLEYHMYRILHIQLRTFLNMHRSLDTF